MAGVEMTKLAIRSTARRYWRNASGVAATEFAFIFPVMLIAYVGLVDVGNLISANRRVTLTASAIGDLVAQAPGEVTKAGLNGILSAASPIMDPFPTASISLEIYSFTKPSGGGATLAWQHKNATASCGGAPTANATMEQLMAEGNDVIVSRVCYNWTPIVGSFLGIKSTTAKDELMLRPRQAARIICTDCS